MYKQSKEFKSTNTISTIKHATKGAATIATHYLDKMGGGAAGRFIVHSNAGVVQFVTDIIQGKDVEKSAVKGFVDVGISTVGGPISAAVGAVRAAQAVEDYLPSSEEMKTQLLTNIEPEEYAERASAAFLYPIISSAISAAARVADGVDIAIDLATGDTDSFRRCYQTVKTTITNLFNDRKKETISSEDMSTLMTGHIQALINQHPSMTPEGLLAYVASLKQNLAEHNITLGSSGNYEITSRFKEYLKAPKLSPENERSFNIISQLLSSEPTSEPTISEARKQEVVSALSSAVASTPTETQAILNANVDMLENMYQKDGRVAELCNEYRKSQDPKKYARFQKNLREHFQSEKKFAEICEASYATSDFFTHLGTVTKNKDLIRGAQILALSTKAVAGIKTMSSAITAIKSAGTLGLASFSAFMSGAGAVVAVAASFMGGDGGVGKALSQIAEQIRHLHEDLIAMWQEVRESFKQTWEMLSEMEKNNTERFKWMLKAIDITYKELSTQMATTHRSLSDQINTLTQTINDALKYLVDGNLPQTLDTIRIEIHKIQDMDESKFKDWMDNKFLELTTTLGQWLKVGAFIGNGRIDTINGELDVTAEGRIKKFSSAMSIEKSAQVSLGLYASVAQEMLGSSSQHTTWCPQNLMGDPHAWLFVFKVYSVLIEVCLSKGWTYNANATKVFIDQVQEVGDVAERALSFMRDIANSSSLWENLASRYQHRFNELKIELEALQPALPDGKTLPNELRWDLTQTAEENIQRFLQLPNINDLAMQLPRDLKWIGLKGVRREDLEYKFRGWAKHKMHRTGDIKSDLDVMLSETQYKALIAYTNLKTVSDELCVDFRFLLACFYNQASSALAYYPRNCSENGSAKQHYCLYLVPSLRISEDLYPICQMNLFHNSSYSSSIEHAFYYNRSCNQYGHNWDFDSSNHCTNYSSISKMYDPHASYYHDRPEFLDRSHIADKLSQAVDEHTLKPAIKQHADTFSASRLREEQIEIQCAYMRLIAFIKLLDPNANVTLWDRDTKTLLLPEALVRLAQGFQELRSSPSAQNFKNLMEALSGKNVLIESSTIHQKVWQEELWQYLSERENNYLAGFDVEKLREVVTRDYQRLDWVRDLSAIPQRISELREAINNNTQAMEQELSNAENARKSQDRLLRQTFATASQSKQRLEPVGFTIANSEVWTEAEKNFGQPSPLKSETAANNAPNFFMFKKGDVKTENPLYIIFKNPNVDSKTAEILITERRRITPKNDFPAVLGDLLPLAIQHQRDDLVELLLVNDADTSAVDLENSTLPENANEKQQKILALLHFYHHLETLNLGDKIHYQTVFSLIKKQIEIFNRYREINLQTQPVVLIMGKTSLGKSTMINHFLGVDYYEAIDEDDGSRKLTAQTGHIEIAKTSDSLSISETTGIELFNGNEFLFADVQGFEDSRGDDYEMALGVSAKMLGSVTNQVQAVVLVVDPGFLTSRGIEKNKILNQFAAIFSHDINNAFIVLNNKAGAAPLAEKFVINVFKKMREEVETYSESTLSEKALSFLKNIPETNIIIADLAENKCRDDFFARIKSVRPQSFDQFNFTHFIKEHEKLDHLIDRVETYARTATQNRNSMVSHIARDESVTVRRAYENLEKTLFTNPLVLNEALPSEIKKAYDACNQSLEAQKAWKARLLNEILIPLLDWISKNQPTEDQHFVGGLSHFQQSQLRIEIARTFLGALCEMNIASHESVSAKALNANNNPAFFSGEETKYKKGISLKKAGNF